MAMKIDAWTHLLSPSYARQLEAAGQHGPGAFLLAQRALREVDFRLGSIDLYNDYRQILTPIPGMHVFSGLAGQALIRLIQRNNDEMAEIVQRNPERFAGFAAATPVTDPEAAAQEAIRSMRELGALGVQLEEDALNLPLHEGRYEPLFAALDELAACIWLHPYRTPATPGSPAETNPFLLWQVFGWTFDTTITIGRLIFSGIYDRHPGLKLIAHHGGGLIPHFSGRIEIIPWFTGLDSSLREALERLQRPPIDYFRMLYVDTAMFGSAHGVRCVVDFFGSERVLFGTDSPFDTKAGSHFIPITISDVEEAVRDESARAAIFEGNISRIISLNAGPPAATP